MDSKVTKNPMRRRVDHLIKKVSAIGQSKKVAPHKIRSKGTRRIYRQHLQHYFEWREDRNLDYHNQDSVNDLIAYLEDIAEWVTQKSLDQHRMALQRVFHKKIKWIKAKRITDVRKRCFDAFDVMSIAKAMPSQYAVPVMLSFFSGLRAHEVYTIKRAEELARSDTRKWDPDLFCFMENHIIYTVTGKGGLVRHVALPNELAKLLEQRRLPFPRTIIDREIEYVSYYDVIGGQRFSQKFGTVSRQILGFNHHEGAHGLRHSYAQNRIKCILIQGIPFDRAKELVSQELGHFRPQITNTYLR